MRVATAPPGPATTGEIGIALVEILVSLSLLAIGFLSLVATLAQNARLQRLTHERHLAVTGAESMLEDLRQTDFQDLVSTYGTTSGRNFDLVGLSAQSGDADGHVGRIEFLLDEKADDPIATSFELPRDLNGDGDRKDSDVSSDYRLLPIRIFVEWQGATGPGTIEIRALLFGPEDTE